VSSTAHLLIGEKLLGFDDPMGTFTVMIQLGSILAIVWLYRVKILHVVTALPSDPDARRFAAGIIVAVIPALVAGAVLSSFVKSVLYETPAVYAATFIIGGVVMLIVDRFRPTPVVLNAEHTPLSRAFGVGLCQMLAIVPGVSRSGATIVGGMLQNTPENLARWLSNPDSVKSGVLMILPRKLTSQEITTLVAYLRSHR